MLSRRLKIGYFVLEGLNSFATVYYFYYFYFYMQQAFGFGNKANLLVAALSGATYAVGAWWGGKYAQEHGYFTALKLGFAVMAAALIAGLLLSSATAQIVVMTVVVLGMCFTWPTLEALISEGETADSLPSMVGVYNLVWAGTAAIANFTGGAMLEHLGLRSLFYVPAASLVCQLALTLYLESLARQEPVRTSRSHPGTDTTELAAAPAHKPPPTSSLHAGQFLRMAWLANPFAYIAINTLIAVIPGVAHKLQLSTMLAGFCCSVWCFARLGAFWVLWLWVGWHYRFRWLLFSYVALVAAFVVILTVPNVAVLVLAQVIFGGAVGLIYYSSLFYSMDLSDTKGEHGGIHEAAIGLGNFAGPVVGAASLHFLPQYTNSGAMAVSGLLLLGLGSLLAIWRGGTKNASRA